MRGLQTANATILATLVTASLVGMAVLMGGAVADQHTKEQAPDQSENANFTVNLPYATDHHPGDQNEENGSIEYFASGDDAFAEMDAEDGVYFDYVIIDADWIDYSACDTENTEAFGIDRGNDNEGTQTDEDLVERQKDAQFRDDGITVEFFDWDDIAGDPPYMAPEDAIVASQGQGSAGGPCLTMTDEPGWYQIQGFANGTVADNGEGEEPSEDAEEVGMNLDSNYLYVCDCDDREEAEEELGPPPSDEDAGDPDEEQSAEGDDGEAEDDGEEDAGDDGESEDDGEARDDGEAGDAEDGESEDGEAGDADDGESEDDEAGDADDGESEDDADDGESEDDEADDVEPAEGDDDETPSGDGPGFGALGAVIALLASALLVGRRR